MRARFRDILETGGESTDSTKRDLFSCLSGNRVAIRPATLYTIVGRFFDKIGEEFPSKVVMALDLLPRDLLLLLGGN